MKVKVIGSGSIRSKSNSACYLIDDEIMVDFPNGTCKALYRLNIIPSDINYVLITHFHGDHFFDTPFYIFDKYSNENSNTNIYCINKGNRKIKKLTRLAFPNSFLKQFVSSKLRFVNKNNFKINNYMIQRVMVKHSFNLDACGYIFDNGDKIIGFTGDSSLCKNVEYMASICDYLFCDCTKLIGDDIHLGIDNIKYLCEKYPNCHFIASHMGENARQKLPNKRVKNLIKATDGKIINI